MLGVHARTTTPRAQGKNWRGVNRTTDVGHTPHDLAVHDVRLLQGYGIDPVAATKEETLLRWGSRAATAGRTPAGECWAAAILSCWSWHPLKVMSLIWKRLLCRKRQQ